MNQYSPRSQRQLCLVRDVPEKQPILAGCELFTDLRAEELQELSANIPTLLVPAGYLFSQPGDTQTRLFILQSGRVQVYYLSSEGHKFILTTIEPVSWFGEAALARRPARAFTVATEPAKVSVLHPMDWERLLARREVAAALCHSLARRLQETEAHFADAMFRSVSERLASLLLRLAQPDTPQHAIVHGFSHQDLANLLGVHRETVTLALSHLRSSQIVAMGRKHITLLNVPALRELAHEERSEE